MSKEMNSLIKDLLKEGWEEVSNNKHLKLKWKGKRVLVVSRSPSCHRAHLNIRKQADRIMKEEVLKEQLGDVLEATRNKG